MSPESDSTEAAAPAPGLEPWSPEPDPTAFPPEPEPEPEVAPAPPPPAPAPAPPPPGLCHGSRPCKRLLALGGVAAALGAGTIAAGVVLTTRRDQLDPHDPTTLISYRPIGGAALAVGTGLLTTWLLTLLAAVRAGRLAGRPAAREAAR